MQGNLKHSKGNISKLEKRGHLYFALTIAPTSLDDYELSNVTQDSGAMNQIKGSAAKELQTVAKPDRIRIIKAIDVLAENPFSGKALKGRLRS